MMESRRLARRKSINAAVDRRHGVGLFLFKHLQRRVRGRQDFYFTQLVCGRVIMLVHARAQNLGMVDVGMIRVTLGNLWVGEWQEKATCWLV